MRGPDRVLLEELAVDAKIGVYKHEKGVLQRLVISVEIETALSEAAQGDALAKTIDYDRVANVCRTVAMEQHHELIETVAEKIAALVLQGEAGADAVFVRVAKPGAVPDAKTVAVEISRIRTERSDLDRTNDVGGA